MTSQVEIITLIVGQMQENCYLVYDSKSLDTVIIDPGDDADYIERIIADNKLIPRCIISTHGHFDHIMAVTELKLAYNIPFLIHKNDEFLVKDMQSSAKYFLRITTDPPPQIDEYLNENKLLTINNQQLTIIHTPGHTPGSCCFYLRKEAILFTGDLVFADGGVGRTDFSYSDIEKSKKSIKKIFSLPPKTQILPGHGRSSTLVEESKYYRL